MRSLEMIREKRIVRVLSALAPQPQDRLRDEVNKGISRTAAALLITGLCAALATAQNKSPLAAPAHVLNRGLAVSGQTSTGISSPQAEVVQPNSGSQQNQ